MKKVHKLQEPKNPLKVPYIIIKIFLTYYVRNENGIERIHIWFYTKKIQAARAFLRLPQLTQMFTRYKGYRRIWLEFLSAACISR
jgi:hypothetical protein